MRVEITPKDIATLKGIHIVTARILYRVIMREYKKTKQQGLQIAEYCKYVGADERFILSVINPDKKVLNKQ